MYIMGMRGSSYYFSWFIRYFVVMVVIHLICTIIIVRTLPHIPFYIVFIVFILFDIVLIIQNFFIQVFLTRAKIGVVIALLFFLVQFILSFLATNSDNPSIGVNAALSIIPHAAFVIAFRTIVYAESFQISPTFGTNLNSYVIGYALVSFILNAIFYLLLTWYLDQVVPNEWGAKRHPFFCCVEDTSTISPEEKEIRKRETLARPGYHDRYEEVEQGLSGQERENRAIEIVGLRKEFGSGEDLTVAVSDLTVSMFQGQIFALLGHNGAGKTTTISMLTGMVSPTDGYLSVMGHT
jgi:ATP-binding cassette, subfamily A (ABC1), member 3